MLKFWSQAELPWSGGVPLRRRCKLVLFYSDGTEKVEAYNYAAWRQRIISVQSTTSQENRIEKNSLFACGIEVAAV
jgi:hypothetical protein